MTINTQRYQELLHAYCMSRRFGTDVEENAAFSALVDHIDTQRGEMKQQDAAPASYTHREVLGLCDQLIHTPGRDARALACELRPKVEAAMLAAVTPVLPRQTVASVVSRVGDELRVGWLRPERCDVGTLLYCAAEPVAAVAPSSPDLAALIHYPECWDTAAYPTLAAALHECVTAFRCSEHAAVAPSDATPGHACLTPAACNAQGCIDPHAKCDAKGKADAAIAGDDLNGGMHASIFVKVWGDAGGGDAGRIALANYVFELGRRSATSAADAKGR